SRRDADRRGSPRIQKLCLVSPLAVEDLNSPVSGVSDVHVALRIERDAVRRVELAWLYPSGTPGLDKLAVLVELGHPGVAVTIGHINVSSRVPCHVGGPLKNIALSSRARKSAARSCRRTLGVGRRTGSTAPSSGSTGRGLRCERQSWDPLSLLLSAQQHLNTPVRVELDNHVRHLIDNPDVV